MVQAILLVTAIIQIALWAHAVRNDGGVQYSAVSGSTEISVHSKLENKESEAKQLSAVGMNAALWLHTPILMFNLCLYLLLLLLFQQYQKGQIYSSDAVTQIRRVGLCLLLWPLFDLIYDPALILSLKLIGMIDTGELNLVLNTDNLTMLSVGLMTTVIGWIMAEGQRLQEEQELTI